MFSIFLEGKYMENYYGWLGFSSSEGEYDPYLLENMERAVARIVAAVDEREKIIILGSLSMDKIISISLLLRVLRYLNADVEYYIPEVDEKKNKDKRILEHTDFFQSKLIIALGCENLSDTLLCSLKHKGIDVISINNCIPEINMEHYINYCLVINPNVCTYPCKYLSISGVTYKLLHALYMYYGLRCYDKYIDLVMFGTLLSGKPLKGENTVVIENGLNKIRNTEVPGIRAILTQNNIMEADLQKIHSFINTIENERDFYGGSTTAKLVIELFTTSEEDRATQICKYLNNEMTTRKLKV